jgi:hypothetical protein
VSWLQRVGVWLLRFSFRDQPLVAYIACEPDGRWSVHVVRPPDGRTVLQFGSFGTDADASAYMMRLVPAHEQLLRRAMRVPGSERLQ